VWLLACRRRLPLVVARRGDQAPLLPERIAKHRPRLDRFGTGVERRDLEVLQWPLPPARHEAPPHRHEVAPAVALDDRVYRVGRADLYRAGRLRSGSAGTDRR